MHGCMPQPFWVSVFVLRQIRPWYDLFTPNSTHCSECLTLVRAFEKAIHDDDMQIYIEFLSISALAFAREIWHKAEMSVWRFRTGSVDFGIGNIMSPQDITLQCPV